MSATTSSACPSSATPRAVLGGGGVELDKGLDADEVVEALSAACRPVSPGFLLPVSE